MSNASLLAKLKKDLTREFIGPFSGITFKIRKLRVTEYMNYMKTLPISVSKPLQDNLEQFAKELEERKSEEPELRARNDTYLLQQCVISPKIYFGDPEQCPDDQVPFDYLGNDVDLLIMAIFNLANFQPAPGGSAVEGDFLPESSSGPAGPGGETVLATTVEPAPQENV